MSRLSDYLEAALLNHLFRQATSPRENSYWIALFTSPTTDGGGGTEVSTGNWTNYERQQVLAESGNTEWAAAASEAGGGHRTGNTEVIDFGTAEIPGSDVEVTHIAIMTASSGGNMMWHGPLTTPRLVQDDTPVEIPVDALGPILR